VRPSIFSTSGCHPSFFPLSFSFFIPFFILLIYSSSLFFSLHIVLLNVPQLHTPKSSFFFFCTHLLYLGFFMNLISIIPVQQAPNTHLWLIPSHLGLLHAPPSLDEFLGGFLGLHNFPYYSFLYFPQSLRPSVWSVL
jgi:hypothetical protein